MNWKDLQNTNTTSNTQVANTQVEQDLAAKGNSLYESSNQQYTPTYNWEEAVDAYQNKNTSLFSNINQYDSYKDFGLTLPDYLNQESEDGSEQPQVQSLITPEVLKGDSIAKVNNLSSTDSVSDALSQYNTLKKDSVMNMDGTLIKDKTDNKSDIDYDMSTVSEEEKVAARKNKYEELQKSMIGKADRESLINYVKSVAEQYSAYYRKYKYDNVYLPYTDDDWFKLGCELLGDNELYLEKRAQHQEQVEKILGKIPEKALLEPSGDYAIQNLCNKIQDEVASHQSYGEKTIYTIGGIGCDVVGTAVMIGGLTYGLTELADALINGSDYEGENRFQNGFSRLINNAVTRYGNDIVEFGSIKPEDIKEAKEIGLSNTLIMQTVEGQQKLFDGWNTIFLAGQSAGFTTATVLAGAGMGFAAKCVVTLGKKAAISGAKKQMAKQLGRALTREESLLINIQKGMKANKQLLNFNRFANPVLMSGPEAAMEAIQTRNQVAQIENNVKAYYNNIIMEEAMKIAHNAGFSKLNEETGKYENPYASNESWNKLIELLWKKYDKEYQNALTEVQVSADKACATNFLSNMAVLSVTNGVLMSTFLPKSTQATLRDSKLFGIPKPKVVYKTLADGTVKAETKYTFGQLAWIGSREVLSESFEEGYQTSSNKALQAVTSNNIENFVKIRHNNEGTMDYAETLSGDLGAAFGSMAHSFIDKETYQSAILGGLGSIIGSPMGGLKFRGYTGRYQTTTVKDKNGNLVIDKKTGQPLLVPKTDIFGNLKLEKSFKLGVKANGEKETVLDRVRNIMPWSSGAISPVLQMMDNRTMYQNDADRVADWIARTKDKQSLLDGCVGTANWVAQMNEDATRGDIFGIKNSAVGKLAEAAFMLQSLQGTTYYEEFMENLVESANLEEDSKSAILLINQYKKEFSSEAASMSDKDILEKIKKNAKTLQDALNSVYEESDNLESYFGEIDAETKQALIYGNLLQKNSTERVDNINKEFRSAIAGIVNTKGGVIDLTDEQLKLYIRMGSMANIKSSQDKTQKKVDDLEKDIKDLENKKKTNPKSFTSKEEEILKEKKDSLKSYKKALAEAKKITKDMPENVLLNESQIMNLDEQSRAMLLMIGYEEEYEKLHKLKNGTIPRRKVSDEQKAVIDNLRTKLMQKDDQTMEKVMDAARLRKQIDNLNEEKAKILNSPKEFSKYCSKIRQNAIKELYRYEYDRLKKIDDYKTFEEEYQKIQNEDPEKAEAIAAAFDETPNDNWKKHKKVWEDTIKLLDTIINLKEFNNLDENDQSAFAQILYIARNNDVNIDDSDALKQFILNHYEEIVSNIDKFNAGISEEEQIVVPTQEEIFDIYNDILQGIDTMRKATQVSETKIEESATTQKSGEVTVIPGSSIENNQSDEEEKNKELNPEEDSKGPKAGETGDTDENNDIINTFNSYIKENISTKLQTVVARILNQSNNLEDDMSSMIDILQKNKNLSDEDIVSRLNITFNTEYSLPESDQIGLNEDIIDNLKPYRDDIQNGETVNAETNHTVIEEKNNNHPNSESKQTVATDNPKRFKDLPETHNLKRALKDYKVEEFLSDNKNSFPENTPVYYMVNGKFKKALDNIHDTENDIPIFAVVELKDGDNLNKNNAHPIKIEVQNADGSTSIKEFQVIGIMPNSNDARTDGSAVWAEIRKNIDTENLNTYLLQGADGKPLKSSHVQKVKASNENKTTSIKKAVENTRNRDKDGRRWFLSKLKYDQDAKPTEGTSSSPFYIEIDKGNNEVDRRDIKISDVWNMYRQNGGKLLDVLKANHKLFYSKDIQDQVNIQDVIEDNTCFYNAYQKFNEALKQIQRDLSNYNDEYENGIYFDEEDDNYKKAIAILSSKCKDIFHDQLFIGGVPSVYIRLKNQDNKNIVEIVLTDNSSGQKAYDNIVLTTLDLSKDSFLGVTNENGKDAAYGIIDALVFTGESEELRKKEISINNTKKSFPFFRFQISSDLLEDYNENPTNSRLNVLYDQGFFYSSSSSFDYEASRVNISYPQNATLNSQQKTTEARQEQRIENTNADNANFNSQNTSNVHGATINNDNGLSNQHSNEDATRATEPEIENIPEEVKRMLKDSKQIVKQNKKYTSVDNRRTYFRVTTLAHKDNDEEYDDTNPYHIPSTTIGTSVDQFVRAIFDIKNPIVGAKYNIKNRTTILTYKDGTIVPFNNKFSNIENNAAASLFNSIHALKISLDAEGSQVFSQGIKVSGTVNITDDKNKVRQVPVAGEIDLLIRYSDGTYGIVDMKTHHGILNAEQYKNQLNLYANLLEQKYGITVRDIKILPFSVNYEDPSSSVVYSKQVDENTGNEILYKNGEISKTDDVSRSEYRVLDRTNNISFNWNNFTNEEKSMIKSSPEAIQQIDTQSTVEAEESQAEITTLEEVGDNSFDLFEGVIEGIETISEVPQQQAPINTSEYYEFGKWTGHPNPERVMEFLMRNKKNTLTEEQAKARWDNMSQQEKDITLKCCR